MVAALVVGAAATGGTPAHGAVSNKTLDRLSDASCPAPYRATKVAPHTDEMVKKARAGRFRVLTKGDTTLVPPVNWHKDPFNSVKFRGKLHNFTWIDVLFYAYREGDKSALRQAKELILDWIKQNPRRGRRLPDKAWGDKISGDRAPYVAYLARAATCEGMLSRGQARRVLNSIETHAKFLSNPENHAPSNHGLFVDFGLVLLDRQLPFMPNARDWGKLGAKRFERTLRQRSIQKEGFWLEHSANYQLVIVGLLTEFLAASRVKRSLPQMLKRMRDIAGWLTAPDGEPVLLGDTNLRQVSKSVRDEGANDNGLRWLPRSGLAVVKQQDPPAFLSMAATFFSRTHKHSDELTFDLFDRGQRIVSDTGNFANDPGPLRDYSRSAPAHSVLTVDGRGFSRRSASFYGSGLRSVGNGDGWHAVQGINPILLKRGVRHRRLWLYKPGFALFVVDQVRSKRKHVYRRYFQLGEEIDTTRRPASIDLDADGFSGALSSSASANEKRSLVKGQDKPLRGFIFPHFRQKAPRWTVTYRTEGKDVDHIAAFALDPEESARASLAGKASAKRTSVDVEVNGEDPYRLEVTRAGSKLTVKQKGP